MKVGYNTHTHTLAHTCTQRHTQWLRSTASEQTLLAKHHFDVENVNEQV